MSLSKAGSLPLASLPEHHASVAIPQNGRWRRMVAFVGPGYLVAVGYMDPGNWATDLAAGSIFGNELLSVVAASSLLAILLQTLSARLGIGAGLDLAQACRARYGRRTTIALWLLCEVAIVACDLAEVLGTAIALQLLFGLPLLVGVVITAFDVFLLLALQRYGFRTLEALVAILLLTVAGCFAFELWLARPLMGAVLTGFVPRTSLLTDPARLYLAVGILGATVMPHNLYLHSSVVQTRGYDRGPAGRASAIRFATLDTVVALGLALFVNAAILALAAATFHRAEHFAVADLADAYRLLTPLLGTGSASIVFAVALLAAGQNSTLTGTLAGQIVAEGFLHWRLPIWARRLVTRGLAVIPAAIVIAIAGERSASSLLIMSQVVLSLQLPFAVVPLVRMTGDKALMGALVSPAWLRALAWLAAALVIALNVTLLAEIALAK